MIGISLQLFNGATPRATLSNIKALWWDSTDPDQFGRPVGKSSVVTTDASGYISLDISNVSGLTIGDSGFLTLYQLNETDSDESLVFSGIVPTSDIISGVDMYYYDDGWDRPADWPELDAPVDGVQKVQGLWAVYNLSLIHI